MKRFLQQRPLGAVPAISAAYIFTLLFMLLASGFISPAAFAGDERPERDWSSLVRQPWSLWPEKYPLFDYSGERLREQWDDLHLRDGLPWPDKQFVIRQSGPEVPGEPEAAARRLQDGWRHFHEGNFREARRIGDAEDPAGSFLSSQACLALVLHRVDDKDIQAEMLRNLAGQLEKRLERDFMEPAYWEKTGLALIYGEYSRRISALQARREGIPDRIRDLVDSALEEKPDLPVALGVLGAFHAEIVDRVGGFLGGVTYGASRDDAERNFEKALKVDPGLIQVRVEYARALLTLHGDDREEDAMAQLEKAIETKPLDALDLLGQLRGRRVKASWKETGEVR